MAILNFHQTTPEAGDCTANYDVTTNRFRRNYTVSELIGIIMQEQSGDWGSITICPVHHCGDPCIPKQEKVICEYKHGKLTNIIEPGFGIYENKRPHKITSHGGWTAMNYYFYVKI